MEWLKNNAGTIIISILLAAVVILVIAKMIRDKKKGKSSCGCGCSGCAMRDTCHTSSRKESNDT